MRRYFGAIDTCQERRKPLLPVGYKPGETRITFDPAQRFAALIGVENAKHVFAGKQIGRGRLLAVEILIEEVADIHDSRHPRSCSSPRRIQLLTEPSGDEMRCASSS